MENDDNISSESSLDSSGSSDQSSEDLNEISGVIQPYQYEPDASSSDEDSNEEMAEENNSRLQDLDW